MIVLVPVRTFAVRYVVASGRPFSSFERLVHEAIAAGHRTLDELHKLLCVHRRVVVEALVTLMHAGWIEIDAQGGRFIASGVAGDASDQGLPPTIKLRSMSRRVVQERVYGQVASIAQAAPAPAADIKKWRDATAILKKSDLPNSMEPGMVEHLLRKDTGEWVHAIDEIVSQKPDGDFVLAQVDLPSRLVTGIPVQWVGLLRDDIVDAAKRYLAKRSAGDAGGLLRHVSRYGGDTPARATASATWDPGDILVTAEDHERVLRQGLAAGPGCTVIVSATVDATGLDALDSPIRAACAAACGVEVAFGACASAENRVVTQRLSKLSADTASAAASFRAVREPTGSRANLLLVAPSVGDPFAVVGSYSWLAAASDHTHLSIVVRAPVIVAQLMRLVAGMLRADARTARGSAIVRLENGAAELLAGAAVSTVVPHDEGSVMLRLVVDEEHYDLLPEPASRSEELRIDSASLAIEETPAFRSATAALRAGWEKVSVRHGPLATADASERVADLEKLGAEVAGGPRFKRNAVAVGNDCAIVTSYSWLGRRIVRSRAIGSDVGIAIEGASSGRLPPGAIKRLFDGS